MDTGYHEVAPLERLDERDQWRFIGDEVPGKPFEWSAMLPELVGHRATALYRRANVEIRRPSDCVN